MRYIFVASVHKYDYGFGRILISGRHFFVSGMSSMGIDWFTLTTSRAYGTHV